MVPEIRLLILNPTQHLQKPKSAFSGQSSRLCSVEHSAGAWTLAFNPSKLLHWELLWQYEMFRDIPSISLLPLEALLVLLHALEHWRTCSSSMGQEVQGPRPMVFRVGRCTLRVPNCAWRRIAAATERADIRGHAD